MKVLFVAAIDQEHRTEDSAAFFHPYSCCFEVPIAIIEENDVNSFCKRILSDVEKDNLKEKEYYFDNLKTKKDDSFDSYLKKTVFMFKIYNVDEFGMIASIGKDISPKDLV